MLHLGEFGNVILVTLFVFFGNTRGVKKCENTCNVILVALFIFFENTHGWKKCENTCNVV